ncbi:DUF3110 domain-containing protein [Synechococcus sp. ATX 2A4]|uniref:DUF3110 domain-containing protein n=1 Tax=Synechococcus sp. ATX 2A4 TaxID=2823727 RepID=UPI0020CE1D5F|nr:DUF3110 domain-containing protein [Synechococcus sp. ATX 2A4]MCP9884098.1 DUF3110 domain-containing protein [Synechococcus sp. ATX 2A4]
MTVHVLLFDAGTDNEGIHSLELGGHTVVLLFEDPDDAERYAGLLEAQDFPLPSVEPLEREEMELFCAQAGYEARFVPSGFLPQSPEERLWISPPERNMDVSSWNDDNSEPSGATEATAGLVSTDDGGPDGEASAASDELEAFRRRLEGLL